MTSGVYLRKPYLVCRNGHQMTPENTLTGNRSHKCRACADARYLRRSAVTCADCGKPISRNGKAVGQPVQGRSRCNPCRQANPPSRRYQISCKLCRKPTRPRCQFCEACRRERLLRSASHRRRAALFGVPYEPVRRSVVFERDNWRCGICRKRIDRRLKYPHPRSASLDHITPMALGGGHVYENVQAAHWACNVAKGHTGAGDQLALIG